MLTIKTGFLYNGNVGLLLFYSLYIMF